MPVYNEPGISKYPDVPCDITVRINIWSISVQLVKEAASSLGIDLKEMGFVGTSGNTFKIDLKGYREINDCFRLFDAIKDSGPSSTNQDLWFQSSLDYFRDASYVDYFVAYCRGTPYSHNLEVGKWGRGASFGKASVLYKVYNAQFRVILEALGEIKTALCS